MDCSFWTQNSSIPPKNYKRKVYKHGFFLMWLHAVIHSVICVEFSRIFIGPNFKLRRNSELLELQCEEFHKEIFEQS
jgi:hypothetical protein